MNSFRTFQDDDEDDTHLFRKAEEYVLKNYPNPDRVGCPGPAVLRAFVESPRSVELSELNDLHIMRCAECTRDLIELRREREERGRARPVQSGLSAYWNWKFAAIAASFCLIAFSVLVLHRNSRHQDTAPPAAASGTPLYALVDLSGDGVVRGNENTRPAIMLPGKLLNLHLLLPYYSPSGNYRIFLTQDKGASTWIVAADGAAIAEGPRTQMTVRMDLRNVGAGHYFLGTQRSSQGAVYYYAVTIN